ncbi:MAG: hypothetical protein QG652_1705 [Pseudomonadota bacterium]|nr:hypothetical protein [Pseudomonadota bacterium]
MAIIKLLRPFIVFILAALVTLSLSRMGLVIWKLDRVLETNGLFYIFLQGIRFDIVVLGMMMLVPVVFAPVMSLTNLTQRIWNLLVRVYLVIIFAVLVYMELATPSFINQYDLRPNYIFVEYLKYPKEVFSTLWSGYKLQLISSAIITILSGYFIERTIRHYQSADEKLRMPVALLLVPVLFVTAGMMIRSTTNHRPVNPSTVAFSPDPMVNTLPLNSTYSVIYAIYDERNRDTGSFAYGNIEDQRVVEIMRHSMRVALEEFVDPAIPTLHRQQAYVQRQRPLNLVIILEESLSGEFVGALGGEQWTPNLDALSKEGIWFEDMHATGTRSVRGIEAVVTGFLPTSSTSVVKLNKSQRDFFTIAQLLSRHNYDTSFIYGGESHFDNMKGFFANNGFKKVYDENDYENPVFYGSWGVSDEDLFNKAHEVFSTYSADKPFFSLVFTSSNHPPFDFPDGRIEIKDGPKQSIPNAVRYTDYALGEFFKKAKQSKYWDNTLFVIVADHCDKVSGAELVPVTHYHIPALMLGADIKPVQYKPLASQIDLMPTALSLMGVNSQHPMTGFDLAPNILEGKNDPGRAVMQFDKTLAYMEGDRVAIYQKNLPVKEFHYAGKTLVPSTDTDLAFEERGLAHIKWPVIAYQEMLYRLPPGKNLQSVRAGN